MAHQGEAADYYNGQNGEQKYNASQARYDGPQYMPPPPTYAQNFGQWNEKPTFDQAFKVEKPKWTDIWAGLLFIAVFAGFTAVSGIR
jgi:hypothetical protein